METTLAVACGDGANEQNWVEGMKPDSPDDEEDEDDEDWTA